MENATLDELLQQTGASSADANAFFITVGLFLLAFAVIGTILEVLNIIGRWKTVKKMGGPGWSQLIPFYSEYALSSTAGCAQALVIAFTAVDVAGVLFGFLNNEIGAYIATACGLAWFVIRCFVLDKVSKRFGKGTGFTVGLVILPSIFYPILGLGSAQVVDAE